MASRTADQEPGLRFVYLVLPIAFLLAVVIYGHYGLQLVAPALLYLSPSSYRWSSHF